MTAPQLLGEGVARSSGDQARRYNLLAARLISELVRNSLGPRGLDKLFVDLLGEVTITKDGATLLRKIDVEHPAAKVIIEASNAVDNEVGDGTTSVVVLAGALVSRAEELLEMGIAPSTISDGYARGLELALGALEGLSQKTERSDRRAMKMLVRTCLDSKALSYAGDDVVRLIVDAFCKVADLDSGGVDIDDVKIEEKQGNVSDIQIVSGIVLDKTIDSSAMPKVVEGARILLVDEDLEGKRTRTDAEILITSAKELGEYTEAQSGMIRSMLQHIVDSGANVVFSRKGINTFSQNFLREAGIISIRRVKENDLIWLSKATGASIAGRLDHEHDHDHDHHHADHENDRGHYHHDDIEFKLGYADRVYERQVGEDRMVFVEGCRDPKAVTLLLRANSKRTLDEFHRSALDALSVLRNFVRLPATVAGGGCAEMAMAKKVRDASLSMSGREQLAVGKFADAVEEIPLTIARNAGMNEIDTLARLRSMHARSNGRASTYGVDAIERSVKETYPAIVDSVLVKQQVLKTAVEVTNLLLRVDDVLMAKPVMHTHTHDDGTEHSHAGGDKKHAHDHFDRLGKKQRPMHHYY